jgi:hypothetical protein
MFAVHLLFELRNSHGWIIRSYCGGGKKGEAESNAAKLAVDALETARSCDKKATALSDAASMAADAGIFAMSADPRFLVLDRRASRWRHSRLQAFNFPE